MIYSKITGTGSYLPEKILNNHDLEKIRSIDTGIFQAKTLQCYFRADGSAGALKKALDRIEGKNIEPLFEALKGNTAVMTAEVVNVPARLIKEFRKKHGKPLLKGAFILEDCYVGDDQLDALVSMKSKEELVGDIIGLLQSPARNIISALQANAEKKSGETAPEEQSA
mgnify:CR=1 FL=1